MSFIRLGRPLFLVGGVTMHGLGVAAALYSGARLNVPALAWSQAAITTTQLMVHYANEYFDLAADRANRNPTAWSGGSRVLPAGLLPPRVVLYAAYAFAIAALSADLALGFVVRPAPLTVPLLFLALALSWAYSVPPLRLQGRGLGPIAATLVVAVLTPLTGFYLQAGRLTVLPLLATIPMAGLQFAMLLAVDIPDIEGDAVAGKRTFVVRIGVLRAVQCYGSVLLATYLVLPALGLAGLPWIATTAVGCTAPLAAFLGVYSRRLLRGLPVDLGWMIFLSIGLLVGAAVAQALALALRGLGLA